MLSLRRSCWVTFALAVFLAAQFATFQPLSQFARADEPENDAAKQEAQARKERFTKWMRTYSEESKIRVSGKNEAGADEEYPAELVSNPVFRYSDEERAIPDATLWVWARNARPVALQKVEGNNHGGGQGWTICFTSLSEGLINAEWPMGRKFAARKPGVTFAPIPQAEVPGDTPRGRTAQIKAIKERFSGRIGVDAAGQGGAETRTIAKPLFEYADPQTKMPLGAIFGMSSTGTNPDLLLLVEARRDGDGNWRWEYAHARMTSNSVRVRLDEADVWTQPDVYNNRPASGFENWLFFFLRRDFK